MTDAGPTPPAPLPEPPAKVDPRTGPRRELRLAVLLCLVGAGLLLLATSRVWVSFADSQQLTTSAVRTQVHGTLVAPGARALGLVALAGVVALAATRRLGRVLIGALVLLAGVGTVVVLANVLAAGLADTALLAQQVREQTGGSSSGVVATRSVSALRTRPAWPVVGIGGGVLVTASGLLVAVRGRRWATLSQAYQVPAARADKPEPAGDKAVWDALDSGDDPTA